MRDEMRALRRTHTDYCSNTNRQFTTVKTYIETKFVDVMCDRRDELRTYFKAIVDEMKKENRGLLSDLKKSWKACSDSLHAIEEKESERTVALDNLIKKESRCNYLHKKDDEYTMGVT
jgi:hypothetical protein